MRIEKAEIKEFIEKERKPVFSSIEINSHVKRILNNRGIEKLYKHQVDGIKRVRKGENIVVTAPTASGKSEIFLVPIVEAALEGKRSLVIYPTKALSRDQLERFREFSILGVRSEVYDGDTPDYKRRKIREDLPHVIITNIDMLHFILMNSRLFKRFFQSLKFVVIDEIHTYTGTLGSHASNIIKRLLRIHSYYSKEKLQFICSSATVGNAKEFCEQLTGLKFSFIEGNSAPKARVRHLIVNPLWDPEEEKRESYTSIALKAAKELLRSDQKILIFGNSHSVVERIGIMAREAGMSGIQVYRAGLDRDLRRKLELEFKFGKTNALVTTSALELGMDIGAVDSIILAGFPGTITRVKQRAGRAGRRGREATSVFIARDNPLDQYYAENTHEYLKGEPEDCYVNPANESILKSHLLAMMRDYPADLDEIYNFSKSSKEIFKMLRENETIKEFAGGWIPTKKGLKELREISIRTASEPIRIYNLDAKKFIGEREEYMALGELFPGAIYLHAGEKYLSKELDLERRIAYVSKIIYDMSEYTLALRERTAEVVEVYDERKVFGGKLSYGKVHINDEIYAYVIKDYLKNTTSEKINLRKPLNYEFDSLAIWMDYPSRLLEVEDFPNGLHAVEHVSIAMVPALTGADPNELGGISYPAGRMYIYDGVPNGSGLAKIIYEKFERVQKMAHGRLRSCKCRNGCPSCILDPQCGNNNRYLNKKAAIEILEKLK